MQYTEKLAISVAKIHPIDEKTLRVWKTRNAIPNKYFDLDGSIAQSVDKTPISDSDKYRLLAVFDSRNINFSEIKAIPATKLSDFSRGKGRITQVEYISFKKEIVDLKNKAQPVFKAKSYDAKIRALKEFFKDPRVRPFTFTSTNKRTQEESYALKLLTTETKYQPDLAITEQIIINILLFFQSLIL